MSSQQLLDDRCTEYNGGTSTTSACRISTLDPQHPKKHFFTLKVSLNLQILITLRPEGRRHSGRKCRRSSEDDGNFLRTRKGTVKIDNTTEEAGITEGFEHMRVQQIPAVWGEYGFLAESMISVLMVNGREGEEGK